MQTAELETVTSKKPNAPGEWTLAQIQQAISREIPASMLETKKRGGKTISFIPWYVVNRILDKYAPGWTWEIRSMITTSDRLILTGRLCIPTSEGTVYREATGTETLKDEKVVKDGQGNAIQDELGRYVTESVELAYGDPSSNSEGMAFRRAAAKFGLGLYMYDKK